LEPGYLIEFIEGGRVITGVCLESRKGKVRALTETMKEVQLSEDRIIISEKARVETGQRREGLARKLREISSRREELKAQVDIRGLWEVLQGESQEFSAEEIAELAFGGEVGPDQVSAVVRAMLADRVYFRFKPDGFRPNPPETVEKILIQREREQQKERLLREGSEWIRSLWEGKPATPPPFGEEVVELLKEKAIFGNEAPRSAMAEELLKRAGMSQPLAPFKILVRMGVWSRDENILIHRFGIRRGFPEEVEKEALTIASSPLNETIEPRREDLTHLAPFTVDSPRTRDLDDALSFEVIEGGRYRIGIHIADVTSRVPMGSLLDQEALRRATSIYLPEERIPMLPPCLSEEACSLIQGQVRPAVSLLLEVDHKGNLLEHRFVPSWIRVRQRLSYEEVDQRTEEGDQVMTWLWNVAKEWRGRRVERGALLLPLPEVTVRVEAEGAINIERRERETPSQIIVSEMMIMANWLAASLLREAGVPCIYRVQPEPRERVVSGGESADLLTCYKQRKLLSRVSTQLEPGTHSSLGLVPYSTLTSPIRRYLDLALQRQLVSLLKGEDPPYTREDLERIAAQCEEVMAQASQMEQARQRYWLLRYLEDKKGYETQALVLGKHGQKVQLLLVEFMVEASLPLAAAHWLREGEEVRVRILRARPLDDDLKVEIC